MIIAAASSDGEHIDEHFGRAESFYIFTLNEGEDPHFDSIRHSPAACLGGLHYEPDLQAHAAAFADCDIMIVSRVGECAERLLNSFGVQVFQLPGRIDDAIFKAVRYLEVQKLITG